VFTAA